MISSHFAAKRPEGKKSILRDWVEELPPRVQGTLLTAIRGCDIANKNDPVKLLARAYRGVILHTLNDSPKTFIKIVDYDTSERLELLSWMNQVLADHDAQPHHYLMHLVHSAEVVGFMHPHDRCADVWRHFYVSFCQKLHMTPETRYEMLMRLDEKDEAAFAAKQ